MNKTEKKQIQVIYILVIFLFQLLNQKKIITILNEISLFDEKIFKNKILTIKFLEKKPLKLKKKRETRQSLKS